MRWGFVALLVVSVCAGSAGASSSPDLPLLPTLAEDAPAGDGRRVDSNTEQSVSADDDGGYFKRQSAAYYRAGAVALP